jgi:hypothetical protein
MWVVATLSAILTFLLAFPPEVQARQQSFEAGRWVGTASFDDDSGDLEHCRIEAIYNSDITLAFGLLPDFTLVMVLTNPAWSLRGDVQFPLELTVDRRWSKSVTGKVVDPSGVFVYIGDDWEAFEALRRGRELRVVAARETFEFLLMGSSYGLAEAARCVLMNSQIATHKADPFSIQSDPFATGASTPSPSSAGLTRSEMAGFLAAAGLENATLMTDAQRAEFMPYAQHGWNIGTTFGGFAEYIVQERSLREVLAAEIAGLSQACEGQTFSGSQPPKRIGEVTMVRFGVSCDTSDGPVVMSGTLIQGDASGVVIEHVGSAASPDAVKRADDLIAAALELAYRSY